MLEDFTRRGLSVNEGIAIGARLVKSTIGPMSNDDLRKEKENRKMAEGQVDKNVEPLKFSAGAGNALVLATKISPASLHVGKWFYA